MSLSTEFSLPRIGLRMLGSLSRLSHVYEVRLAECEADSMAAFRLRYEVFNQELGEGFSESHATKLDCDKFDSVMEHLLVIEKKTGCLVGTYRLQTGQMARTGCGFYSAQEFDFEPFAPIEDQLLELGRACIHRQHRTATVVLLLWQAIADYAQAHGCRYLVGCSSLTSQSPAHGHAAWLKLQQSGHLAPEPLRTLPRPEYALPDALPESDSFPIPRLLRAYLGVGAKICGAPAIDREFGTIDFLTILDLHSANPTASGRFLKSLEK